ncbi:probable receptor-like serine threonine- kinase At5g57670 [Olea europaea subsp. europaea]|uniref:Probable receptor-like serine threonine- kinase At5g57670 n=2 Tax=Olea europaea subsp. europaea TaxID=158383 RepID=A0A8S0VL11_OLEEU|nr:probable receptor-like serine threonine- kinase At5g57670 [Olea europaea subsp. europaea]
MRLVERTGVEECSATATAATTIKNGDDGTGGGAVVVVGVKLDARSRELLTWALVKVAQSGDRVIALHILDPSTEGREGKASLLSLVKTFDSVLAAYEGFCNLKQVDLKLKVCRGSPVRKVLAQEVKSCGATSLIVGSSVANHTIRSRTSVAKYCAKNLQKNISVISVNNGKIMFQREATTLAGPESKSKQRKTMGKSPLSLPPERVLSSSRSENEHDSMALVPFKTREMPESRSGWTLLRRVFFHNGKVPETPSPKKSSVMQWMLKLPSRQSVTAIYPDQKHINASSKDERHCTDLDTEKGAIIPYVAGNTSASDFSKTASRELEFLVQKYSSMCRIFSYQELLLATNSFIAENLIGKGGSSRVYRGCLPEGKELAVKILKPSEDVLEHFVSEIEIITSLHHSNIISLVGICFEENNLLLVYNLLSRGSLEDNLHGPKKTGNSFCWEDRYKVALGIAEALDYIHNAAVEPIIHRDVKSSNILLSDAFEPQLSDFGLATWASSSSHHTDTTDVAGTFGYLAPEYFMHGKLNENIDVYAFGVVLLELLSGRKPIDNELPKGEESLVMWANRVMKDGKISQLLDPNLTNAYDYNQFEKMVLAAILCIRRAPQSRPQISLILELLQGDPEALDWATEQVNASDEVDSVDGEQSGTNLQSFINLALLNLEEGSGSSSSTEQNILVEDYLQGRCSHSSSFD